MAAGLLAALPIAYERIQTERTARQVEFVFDYRDLLDIAEYKADPVHFVQEQLSRMKSSGITSMSVYESTLDELQKSRRLDIYSSRDVALMSQNAVWQGDNVTYVLFADAQAAHTLAPLLERGFSLQQVETSPWSYGDRTGMKIDLVPGEAMMKPLEPDPLTIQILREAGFGLVLRLSNRMQPFSIDYMDDLLSRMHDLGVRRVIFDGPEAPGFSYSSTQEDLVAMGELLNKYNMGLATIELLKEQQRGFATLAREVHYNVVRLHSFTEGDGEKLASNLTEQQRAELVQNVSDRLFLAVKDRNIRMIFLNAKPIRNVDKGIYTDALEPLYASLSGHDGAANRVLRAGFTLGPAKQMALVLSNWQTAAKAVLLVACVALIALTISYFFQPLLLASFVIGLVGSAGLYVLSSSLYGQATALAVGICASTLSVILAIRSIQRKEGAAAGSRLGFSLLVFGRSVLISMIGVVFVIGLLNNITYYLVLEQFRGVSMLHLVPIALIGLYLLFFNHTSGFKHAISKLRMLLELHVRIWWLVAAVLAAAVVVYYLSRTGNAGQTSAFERISRAFLENTLGVRPRIKEFLFAHPLFVLGGYLALKHRHAVYLFVAGVIGQLSIVDTFAHLHTPVLISLIRTGYGVGFGLAVGLLLIALWEIGERGWRKWVRIARH